MTRRPWLGLVAWLALPVLLVVGVAGYLVFHDRVSAGEVRPAGAYRLTGHKTETFSATFRTPHSSQLRVQVSVGDGAEGGGDRMRAPLGGVLALVSFAAPSSTTPEVPTSADARPTALSLRSGDRAVEVDGAVKPTSSTDPEPTTYLVAIPGDVDDLELVSTFAGREQSVRLRTGDRELGDFAAFYRPASGQPVVSSSSTATPGLKVEEPRAGDGIRQPYVEGLGWAAPGREWLVLTEVDYRESIVTWRSGRTMNTYHPTSAASRKVKVTGNGQPPVKTPDSIEGLVFAVPIAEPVVVRIDVSAALSRDYDSVAGSPATATMQVSTSTTYPAVIDVRKAK